MKLYKLISKQHKTRIILCRWILQHWCFPLDKLLDNNKLNFKVYENKIIFLVIQNDKPILKVIENNKVILK